MSIQNSKFKIQNYINSDILTIIFIILDPLLTVVFIPRCDNFVAPKVFALHIGVALLAVFWVVRIISRGEIQLCRSSLFFPVALYFAAHAASTLNAKSSYLSLRQLEIFLSYFIVFLFAMTHLNEDKSIRTVLRGIAVVGLLFSIHGMLQHAGIDFLGRQSRYYHGAGAYFRTYSTFGNPDLLAEYLSIALMPAIGLLFYDKDRRWKMIHIFSVAAIAACIYFTKSRGAAISATIGFLLLSILILRRNDTLLRWALLIGSAFVLITTIFLTVRSTTGVKSESIAYRLLTWKIAVAMIADNPFQGVGTGNFHYRYLDYQRDFFKKGDNIRYAPLVNQEKPRHLHNEYLETAVETGIPGLAAFLLIFIVFLWRLVKMSLKSQNPLFIIIFCSALVFWLEMGVGVSLHVPPSGILFWLMMGMAASSIGHDKTWVLSLKPPRVKWEIAAASFILIALLLYNSYRQFDAGMFLAEGKKLMAEQKITDAISEFNKALRLDPGRGELYFQRGAALLMLGDYKRAITDFYHAKRSSADPNLQYDLAVALFQAKQYGSAIEELQKMADMIPAHPLPKTTMRLFLHEMRREQETKRKIYEEKKLRRK